jgi:hypothetical protein
VSDDQFPRLFGLNRGEDVTGVSGTGTVAHGVQFPDGTVVLRWAGEFASTVVWESLDAAMHVHGHDGRTRVAWLPVLGDDPTTRERLDRIESWHARETGPAGMVGDFCICCGDRWPCDTRRMAEGTYVDEPQ